MKKRICAAAWILLMAGLCSGCGGAGETGPDAAGGSSQLESPAISAESGGIAWDDELNVDFTHDYSEEIRADVDRAASDAETFQQELENVERLSRRYAPLAETAQTQGEMNVASMWLFTIWDTELDTLWDRAADQRTEALAERESWTAMREEAALLSVGSSEENGSMYPLLRNSFLEEVTRDRAYLLAAGLAEEQGQPFDMPERSEKYGLFAGGQGTGGMDGYLLTRQGWEGADEAAISFPGRDELNGTFAGGGNGELAFTADDGSVKGIIRIDGWDGARFEVTEAADGSPFSVGETAEFPIVF